MSLYIVIECNWLVLELNLLILLRNLFLKKKEVGENIVIFYIEKYRVYIFDVFKCYLIWK